MICTDQRILRQNDHPLLVSVVAARGVGELLKPLRVGSEVASEVVRRRTTEPPRGTRRQKFAVLGTSLGLEGGVGRPTNGRGYRRRGGGRRSPYGHAHRVRLVVAGPQGRRADVAQRADATDGARTNLPRGGGGGATGDCSGAAFKSGVGRARHPRQLLVVLEYGVGGGGGGGGFGGGR